jgi:hypothetical protein
MRSIRIAPLNPRRRMRSRRRLVLCIRLTITAEASRGFHALLKGRETAIRPAARCSLAVNRAPRIILCLGACSNADDGEANSRQEEEQELHGRLPILGFSPSINAYSSSLFQAHARVRRGRIAANIAKLPEL